MTAALPIHSRICGHLGCMRTAQETKRVRTQKIFGSNRLLRYYACLSNLLSFAGLTARKRDDHLRTRVVSYQKSVPGQAEFKYPEQLYNDHLDLHPNPVEIIRCRDATRTRTKLTQIASSGRESEDACNSLIQGKNEHQRLWDKLKAGCNVKIGKLTIRTLDKF